MNTFPVKDFKNHICILTILSGDQYHLRRQNFITNSLKNLYIFITIEDRFIYALNPANTFLKVLTT